MISVVIPAGGTSSRFKNINKLLYKLNEKPIIFYTVNTFNELSNIDEIIIAANINIMEELKSIFNNMPKVKVIQGGNCRQESVYNGLKACNKCNYVIIHDGARPFIKKEIIQKCLECAKEKSAAIVAVKTIDTVKTVNEQGQIISTPDRKTLWNAQTPQIFEYQKIMKLHEEFKGKSYTDDSLLFEKAGLPVYIVEGEYSNIKITTIEDIKSAEKFFG